MRKFILAIFLVSSLGAGAELFLLEHMEDFWQWVPLVLILLSSVLIIWLHSSPSKKLEQIFYGLMLLSMLSAGLGIFFHLKGNIEFELEMYPNMGGLTLIWESLKGATPALAPGTMLASGMIGLLYLRVSKTDN
ncbi:MAG: hypothetical protein R8P61_16945 [Bacteroidia bacterium]|nr:hypothetical protein [Bacteroidia bacterium]